MRFSCQCLPVTTTPFAAVCAIHKSTCGSSFSAVSCFALRYLKLFLFGRKNAAPTDTPGASRTLRPHSGTPLALVWLSSWPIVIDSLCTYYTSRSLRKILMVCARRCCIAAWDISRLVKDHNSEGKIRECNPRVYLLWELRSESSRDIPRSYDSEQKLWEFFFLTKVEYQKNI